MRLCSVLVVSCFMWSDVLDSAGFLLSYSRMSLLPSHMTNILISTLKHTHLYLCSMANNCEFALSSCAFSGSASRARAVAARLNAGMSAVNDLEGCTYMSQSLPFGGCKKSG